MAELDAILEKYTHPTSGSIHGASFVAVDRDGNYIYRKAFGSKHVDTAHGAPLTLDTVAWIASQTKLTTSVAVMQVVGQGLIGLDDDVRSILPALRDIKVLAGFQEGNPILEDVRGSITLRHLLTHTSGFAYDIRHPLLIQYSAWAGRQDNMFSGTMEGYLHPLVFQPGTSWDYGPGLDWAGQVVETLTGLGLDAYQQQHLWEPLGATHTTFFPRQRGLVPANVQEMAARAAGQGTQGLQPGACPWKFDCRDALGGAGLFSTPHDYGMLLAALLAGGGPLLAPASVDELFRGQLRPASLAAMCTFVSGTGPHDSKSWLWDDCPDHWDNCVEIQYCLCGLINGADVAGRRKKNTVNWDGLPNLLWFVDRESGVAATFFTQILPTDDAAARTLCRELEEALYRVVRQRDDATSPGKRNGSQSS